MLNSGIYFKVDDGQHVFTGKALRKEFAPQSSAWRVVPKRGRGSLLFPLWNLY